MSKNLLFSPLNKDGWYTPILQDGAVNYSSGTIPSIDKYCIARNSNGEIIDFNLKVKDYSFQTNSFGNSRCVTALNCDDFIYNEANYFCNPGFLDGGISQPDPYCTGKTLPGLMWVEFYINQLFIFGRLPISDGSQFFHGLVVRMINPGPVGTYHYYGYFKLPEILSSGLPYFIIGQATDTGFGTCTQVPNDQYPYLSGSYFIFKLSYDSQSWRFAGVEPSEWPNNLPLPTGRIYNAKAVSATVYQNCINDYEGQVACNFGNICINNKPAYLTGNCYASLHYVVKFSQNEIIEPSLVMPNVLYLKSGFDHTNCGTPSSIYHILNKISNSHYESPDFTVSNSYITWFLNPTGPYTWTVYYELKKIDNRWELKLKFRIHPVYPPNFPPYEYFPANYLTCSNKSFNLTNSVFYPTQVPLLTCGAGLGNHEVSENAFV